MGNLQRKTCEKEHHQNGQSNSGNKHDQSSGRIQGCTPKQLNGRKKGKQNRIKTDDKNRKKTVTCLYTNADAITNKLDELQVILELHKPEIIAVTEVKPKNLKTPLSKASLKLDGYELLPNKNCFIPEGRGVCLYVKEDMMGSCKEIACEVGAESVWVKILNIDNSITKFGCLYRSPNSTEAANTRVCQFMKSLDSEENDLVIVGDFNHPEVDWPNTACYKDEDHPAKVFLESVRDGLLIQHVTEATRWREGQSPSTLDLVFTNKEGLISDITVSSPLGKSDHGVIIFKMHCQSTQEKQTKTRYLYSKGNYSQIRTNLDINWEHELTGKDVIQCWEIFKSRLIEAANENIPKVLENTKKQKRPSWMNTSAIAKVKKKHAAWKRYLATKDGQAYQLYARERNQA